MTPHAPGVYDDVPEDEYHADPSLSSTGARLLVDCPAKYRHTADHGERHSAAFDLGKAAHALVLGVGAPVRVVDADDWRTKAAREERDAARADFETPMLRKDWERVCAMAEALLRHPTARAWVEHGRPEVSLFWSDPRHDVPCRARIDYLRDTSRVVLVDIKTTTNASPAAFTRSVASYGYHVQAAWYQTGARHLLDLDEPPPFVFLVQEKEPPYLVGVYELDDDALTAGRHLASRAVAIWRECTDRGEWPAYPAQVLTLPRWATTTPED